jgi:hypothetical protein
MKTNLTKISFAFAALLSLHTGSAQTDLVPGINYSYDPPGSDGVIHNIAVDVCNNESDAAYSFDVSMYLYEPNSGDHWVIDTYHVPSLSGNACNTISNWDIDINNTPGISAGTYRLGIWVDSNDDISESDENNNIGLLDGNINYSPSTVDIKTVANASLLLKDAAPNPASGSTSLSFRLAANCAVSLEILDITGKKVITALNTELAAGDHTCKADLSTLEPGLYFYRLTAGKQACTKKLIVH